MSVADRIAKLVASLGEGPVFVHSDAFRVARLVPPRRDRAAYLDAHLALLRQAAAGRSLWVPAFNYDFPRSGVFDVGSSEVQLGPIPEHFRTRAAVWRTPIPVFSVSGTGPDPGIQWGDATDPFGADSIFARLLRSDGVVLYYGDTFHYNTLVHHAERLAGGPAYRYDKTFPGRVIMPDGTSTEGSLVFHVRPLGTGLDYDWERLLAAALQAGVCRQLPEHPEVLAAPARALAEHWQAAMKSDPLALLDEKSRKWVEPALEELGRPFVIGDFESPEPIWRPA